MKCKVILILPILFFLCSVGAEEKTVEWKRLEKQYSNGTIVFFTTGTIELSKEVGPNGDNWIGTGSILGLDEKGEVIFSGRYVESKKEGEFTSVVIDKNVREINLSSWKAGMCLGSKIITLKSGSKL